MREAGAQRFRQPGGHDGPGGPELLPILIRQLGKDRFETVLDLLGPQPRQGANGVPRLAVGAVSCQRGAWRSSTVGEPNYSRRLGPEVR